MLMMKNSNISRNVSNVTQSSFSAAELRINKDLIEMKKYRITTNLFDVKYSHIFKDYSNNKFFMLVSMEKFESRQAYEFCILFNSNYPFSPPEIHSSNTNISVNLNILTKENWSPVLSTNSILFALELMLLDPQIESRMSFKDFLFTQQYNQEVYCKSYSKNENIIYTNSPKIINKDVFNSTILSHSNLLNRKICIGSNPYYIRKKRLFSELENFVNYLDLDTICSKKFKYSIDSSELWRITNY